MAHCQYLVFSFRPFFANPIAGPFVAAISSGALKLMTALVMIFCGKGLVVGSIILIWQLSGGHVFPWALSDPYFQQSANNMSILVICGIMVSYICSAVTDLVVTFADDSNIVNLHNWSLGSFFSLQGQYFRYGSGDLFLHGLRPSLAKPAGAYQLGEVYAASMGVNIKAFRPAPILVSSILSACVRLCRPGVLCVIRSSSTSEKPV